MYHKLSGKEISNEELLVSLDVVSLFTNVPIELVLEGIRKRWMYLEDKISIPLQEFILAIEFVLTSTFFTFNNIIYKQTFGTPMGSPVSPAAADIVMQDVESEALRLFGIELPLYIRYVDDILMVAQNNQVDRLLDIFNSIHKRLQFTKEVETERCISFLDLSLHIINNKIIIDWYYKDTFSGRYLSFFSEHPICHKTGTIFSLTDRAIKLSHPMYHQKNLRFIVMTLLNNGYPLELIFSKINNRLKTLFRTEKNKTNVVDTTSVRKKIISFPYIKNASEIVTSSIDRNQFTIGYRCLNNLSRLIRRHKDKDDRDSSNNVVYKIRCNDCDASYVSQTKRQIKTRVSEHKRNAMLDISRHSVITNHMLEFNHV